MRRAALARRAAMARGGAPGAARRLARAGLAFLGEGACLGEGVCEISAYIANGSELDPSGLMKVLAGAGHRLSLPVVTGPARPLLFRRWEIGDALEAGAMNIPAPLAGARTVTPHILLVPFLAADRAGYRLGYGGGYYDRTLEILRRQNTAHPPIAVGVGYSAQIVARVAREPHDQPLDWILTQDGAIKTGVQGGAQDTARAGPAGTGAAKSA